MLFERVELFHVGRAPRLGVVACERRFERRRGFRLHDGRGLAVGVMSGGGGARVVVVVERRLV